MRNRAFHLSFEIQSDFRYLPFLIRISKALAVKKSGPLTQILVEAYNNAVLHAHKSQQEKWVGIDLKIDTQKVSLKVIDQGRGLKTKSAHQQRDLWKTSGRGLSLIQAYTNQISSKQRKGLHIFEVILKNG